MKEKPTFIAVERRGSNRKVILGRWKDVQDLDKRIWKIAPWTTVEEPLKRLAVIALVDDDGRVSLKEIFTMKDLEGVYL